MMFCPNCGAQVEDGKYCPECGCKLEAPLTQVPAQSEQPTIQSEQPAAQTYVPPQAPAAPVYPAGYGTPLYPQGQGRVLETVRRLASSRLFLTAAIAFTAALVLSVVGSLIGAGDLTKAFGRFTELLRRSGLYRGAVPSIEIPRDGTPELVTPGTVFGVLFGSALTILTAVGLWMVYAAAKNRKKPMSTGGLTLLKVVTIISLVIICIVAVLFVVLCVATFVLLYSYDGSGGSDVEFRQAGAGISLTLAVMLLFFTLYIVYYAKVIQTINSVRNTVFTGKKVGKVSVFVAIMLFISAFFNLLSLGGSVLSMTLDLMEPLYVVPSMLTTLGIILTLVCIGILILQYRKALRQEVEY